MVKETTVSKHKLGVTFRDDLSSVITSLARIEEQMKAHVDVLRRLELQYDERLANHEKELKAICVIADTALFEARNNTDRIDIMKWVVGGITLFLTTAMAIIMQGLLTR